MLPNLKYNRPHFWRDETSGLLQPVVEQYLSRRQLLADDVLLLRAYLQQWIDAPGWYGPEVDALRELCQHITTRDDVDRWCDRAINAGIDPF